MSWEIRQGDALERLRELESESVQTVVTSPPYWGLRDYGTAEWEGGDSGCDHTRGALASDKSTLAGYTSEDVKIRTFTMPQGASCGKCGARRIDSQLGLEPTPEQYVANLVEVFREVRRVMRRDATAWLNLGDSFSGKQLAGIPWRVAFALQADGWWLRSDIIWAKPNPMPESVTDRPTRAHEYLFLLTKSARYFFDSDAIREEHIFGGQRESNGAWEQDDAGRPGPDGAQHLYGHVAGRNKRSVWEIATQPYPEAHFATFPPKLVEPCILAGSPPKCCGECGAPWERVVETERIVRSVGGPSPAHTEVKGYSGSSAMVTNALPQNRTLGWRSTCDHDDDAGRPVVLDPFCGSGTTGVVALRHDRSFIGIELNPAYCELARNRIRDDAPLLNTGLEVAA